MRIAIIDLGTNSVRFDIHQFGPDRTVTSLHSEKMMIRLGEGVFTTGRLDKKAVHRAVHAFKIFKETATQLGAKKMLALATSALREALDKARFILKIYKETGIKIRVISGQEESRLIAEGVLAREPFLRGVVGLIDIGGGSTEIALIENRQLLYAESFRLGTARIQQLFLKKSPPKSKSIAYLREHIREIMPVLPRIDYLMGSSGTIKALTKLSKKQTFTGLLKRNELSLMVRRMSKMNIESLLEIPKIDPKRVDMILGGAILLEECMLAMNTTKIYFSPYSLRDGILEEQVKRFYDRGYDASP